MKQEHQPYTEARRELQSIAAEIEQERAKLSALIGEYTKAALRAIEAAERLLLPALDERDPGAKVQRMIYTRKAREADELAAKRIGGPIAPTAATPNKNSLGKGKRACSKCRQPGHRSTTCPN